MSPKAHQHQPKAPAPQVRAKPITSGYYPVVETPSSAAPPRSLPPKQPTSQGDAPLEVRVLSCTQETTPVYEIWTEHTVYEFDQSLCCVAVRDAASKEFKSAHVCLGIRLIGGRQIQDQFVHISSPLPAIGHNALLGGEEKGMTVTTPVTRVVMNLCRWSCTNQATRSARP